MPSNDQQLPTNNARRTFIKKSIAGASLITGGAALNMGCSSDDSGSTVSEGLITVNDADLFHARVGSGTPILVMHGGLGLDHSYFRPGLDSWGSFAELIYYDHHGNGRSAVPDDYSALTFESLASDADALRAALGMDKIVLMGHSYGGFLAMEYALRYQENLSGLILASTLPNVGYPPAIPESASAASLAALDSLFREPFADDDVWKATWNQALPLYWPTIDNYPELSADIDARTTYRSAAWNRGFEMLATYNVSGRLGEINVPTLILSGRNDFIAVQEAQTDMDAELPNSELVFFENSGHFPFITEPDLYQQTVSDWVAAL
jgi:proline iminopeptidase